VFQDISLEAEPSIQERFPKFHVERVEKITNRQKCAIEELFPFGGPNGNE